MASKLGVWGISYLTIRFGLAKRPSGMSNMNLYGLSLLAGMGFTMSLFIGSLAFPGLSPEIERQVRIGVLSGSFLSGLLGYFVLLFSNKKVRGLYSLCVWLGHFLVLKYHG